MAQAKRRKKFFDVNIPLINKTTQLIAYEPESLVGKHIKYDLTRLLRGKSVILSLTVVGKGKDLSSIPRELKLMPYYLRRMVRKGTNYVEDSFSASTKDNQVKIKPFLVTRRKVSRAVRKALREKAKEELTNYLKTKSTEEIFQEVLRNQLQKTLSLKLKKVYPLSLCEIRVLKVETKKE